MTDNVSVPDDLGRVNKAQLIIDMFTRTVAQYGLWFTEDRHQMGMEKALEVLHKDTRQCFGIGLKRFSDVFDFDIEDGLPAPFLKPLNLIKE